jgi:hypothetical protein
VGRISLRIGRRDTRVKKDILAIITFVATGFLFYLVHLEGPAEKALSNGAELGAVERVVEEGGRVNPPNDPFSKGPETRDS